MTNDKKRKIWIDALRAIAIIFVIVVHSLPKKTTIMTLYNVVIGPIMIPLFFAISGYVFNDRNGNTKAFFKNLCLKIIIPGFFLSLLWAKFLLTPIKGFSYFLDETLLFISGVDKWYITACIFAEIIFFYIKKFFKSTKTICILCTICFVIGIIMDKLNICNFAMINRAFIAQAYMLIGYIYKTFEPRLTNLKWSHITFLIFAYIAMLVLTIIIWPNQYLDVHLNQYYNIPFCILIIYIGCFTLFLLAQKINRAPRFLIYMGQNTLIFYMMHGKFFVIYRAVISILGLSDANIIILKVTKVFLSIIGCYIITYLLNKFVPMLVGKPFRSNNKNL